jgi:hypothetical protein
MVCIYLYNDFPHGNFGLVNESRHLKGLGVDFVFTDNLDSADIIIFFDYVNSSKIKLLISLYKNKFLVLVRTEPPSVLSYQYENDGVFNLVLDLGRLNKVNNEAFFLEWPISSIFFQDMDFPACPVPGSIILINSNKFGNSNFYYALRRKIAYNLPSVLRTVGSGWSLFDFKFRNFFGNLVYNFVKFNFREILLMNPSISHLFCRPKSNSLSKSELFVDFETVLIIENDNSYISEKIIEALISRTGVRYIGGDVSFIPDVLRKNNILEVKHNFKDIKAAVEDVHACRFTFPNLGSIDSRNLLIDWEAKSVWNKLIQIIIQNYSHLQNLTLDS